MELTISLLLTAFFINFVWEVWHSELYTTCHKMSYWARVRLLTIMSAKDAVWITVLYFMTVQLFGTTDILSNVLQLGVFAGLALLVGYITEYTALKWKRWEYHSTMPRLFGVGVTPLLELAVTGVLSFIVVFIF